MTWPDEVISILQAWMTIVDSALAGQTIVARGANITTRQERDRSATITGLKTRR